jgi:hypothetical protein
MVVNWAEEMGIDLDLLKGEDPFHPIQLANHRAIERRGEAFWAYRRMTAGPEYSPGTINGEAVVEAAVKSCRKPAKVKPYVFTEQQLDIARRSLNAEDRM